MKIERMNRVTSFGNGQANWLATFDVELDDGTRFDELALVLADGKRKLADGHGLAPVLAGRVLAAASDEYDSRA